MDVDYPENNKDFSLDLINRSTPSFTGNGHGHQQGHEPEQGIVHGRKGQVGSGDNADRDDSSARYEFSGQGLRAKQEDGQDGQLTQQVHDHAHGHDQLESGVDVLQIPFQKSRSHAHNYTEYDDNDNVDDDEDHHSQDQEGGINARRGNRSHTTSQPDVSTATPTPTGPRIVFGFTSTSTSTSAVYDNGNVNANLHGDRDEDGAESPNRGVSLSATESQFGENRQTGQIGQTEQGGQGGQRRLSIQELLVNPTRLSTSFSHIHNRNHNHIHNGSRNGSPNSNQSTPSPIWPQVPTSTSGVPVPIGGRTSSPHLSPRPPYQQEVGSYHQQPPGYHSQSHSPVPFPSREQGREQGRERERPGPITLRSFPSSSLRSSSIRALASPYARPSSSQSLTPGLRNEMSVHSATSPVIASALAMDSPAQEQDAGHSNHDNHDDGSGFGAGAGLGITSPGGSASGSGSGSMSTQGRRKAPDWPSPKKKETRSYSFNNHSQPSASASASAQTPREWYVKTPTVLRVPPTAGIQSSSSSSHPQSPAFPGMRHHYDGPSTPVSIAGMGQRQGGPKRTGPGDAPVSASAPARRVHLTDVPKIQVIKALNNKASEYWYSPETSDCRIYVPIPKKKSPGLNYAKIPLTDSDPDAIMADDTPTHIPSDWPPTPPSESEEDGGRPNVVSSHGKTSGMDRKGSGSVPSATANAKVCASASDADVSVLVFPLHRDYLIIQSNLLRTLFQSTSIHMAFRTSPTRPSFNNANTNGPTGGAGVSNASTMSGGIGPAISPSSHTPQARSFPHLGPSSVPRSSVPGSAAATATTPGLGPGSATGQGQGQGQGSRPGPIAGMSIKGARIISSREGEPVSIFLPVPDPASIGVVLHWLYWGDVGSLEKVLSRSMVTWQGIVKNIEYLSLDDSIKRVMGKWWRTWVKTDVGRRSELPQSQSSSNGSQSITSAHAKVKGKGQRRTRIRVRGESSEIESESEDDERDGEGEGEEDGMQIDELHPTPGTSGIGMGAGAGVEGDDGGVSQLLKNL